MCQRYSQRPSTVIGIDSEWLAYDFDLAVSYLGITVENRLQERKETIRNGKQVSEPKYTIQEALGAKPRTLITTHEQAIAMGFIPS